MRGEAFEDTNSHPAIRSAGSKIGYRWADAELRRGMALVLGRADVQLFVVGRLVVSLGRVAIFKTPVLRVIVAWIVEFATH